MYDYKAVLAEKFSKMSTEQLNKELETNKLHVDRCKDTNKRISSMEFPSLYTADRNHHLRQLALFNQEIELINVELSKRSEQ